MELNLVDHPQAKTVSVKTGTKTRQKWPALLFLLLSVAFGASGCADYYGAYPGYGPYYSGYGQSGPGYAAYPGYGAYPGTVTVAVGDQAYYTRGPGYYVGRSYYA